MASDESNIKAINHFEMDGATSTVFKPGIEAAGESWQAAAVLKYSSGSLTEAATDDDDGILVGFSMSPATGTTGAAADYIPFLEGLTFECNLEDYTNGDHALAQSNVGLKYAFRKTASGGLWYLDESDITNVAAIVEALVDPIGTVQGRVRARVLREAVVST